MLDLPHQRNWQAPNLEAFENIGLFVKDAKLDEVVNLCKNRLCYLATPYTKIAQHDDGEFDPTESLDCATRAARWARLFALEGVTAVSPIIQSVEMVHSEFLEQSLDPLDVQFWEQWCFPLLRQSEAIIVPPVGGWDTSDGIWGEVRYALMSGRKVVTIYAGECFGGGVYGV